MALNLALNDVIKAQIVCQDFEQVSINSVYYKVTGIGSPAATLADFCRNFSAAVAPVVKPLISNTAVFMEVVGQVVNPLPLMARVVDSGDLGDGTGGAIGMARQASGLLSFYTDQAGPGFRGRIYVPFPSTSAARLYGLCTTAYTDDLNALGDAMRDLIAVSSGGRTATIEMGLWKRAGNIFTPITKTEGRGVFATQKKRGSYGRANTVPS